MRNNLIILLLALSATASAEDRSARYSPPSHSFTCDLPSGWSAFEEQDGFGSGVHILGPDDPRGVYRAGIDVRWSEHGDPGFIPYKQELDEMKRSDSATGRATTPVRMLRIAGSMVRVFEVTETKRLPADSWPAQPVELHRFVAIFPSGESYFTLTLSSTRDTYEDYRDVFLGFLRSFRAIGYK